MKHGNNPQTPDRNSLLLFMKSPEKGSAKSRLAKDMNDDLALSLYRHFVLDILETLKTVRYPLKICFHPPDAFEKVSAWIGKGYSYMPQTGNDLGERMKNAFLEMFTEGFTKVVLIGSDVPDLTPFIIDQAFEQLDHSDAVIGPSLDGGYYLIGFKRDTFTSAIFVETMQWGTNEVFRQTMALFYKKRYRVRIMPEKRDVDRIEDLRALADHSSKSGFADSGTMVFIRNNFEALFGKEKS